MFPSVQVFQLASREAAKRPVMPKKHCKKYRCPEYIACGWTQQVVLLLQTVVRTWSHSNLATSIRNLKHRLPFNKEHAPGRVSSYPVERQATQAYHAAHHQVFSTPMTGVIQSCCDVLTGGHASHACMLFHHFLPYNNDSSCEGVDCFLKVTVTGMVIATATSKLVRVVTDSGQYAFDSGQ